MSLPLHERCEAVPLHSQSCCLRMAHGYNFNVDSFVEPYNLAQCVEQQASNDFCHPTTSLSQTFEPHQLSMAPSLYVLESKDK